VTASRASVGPDVQLLHQLLVFQGILTYEAAECFGTAADWILSRRAIDAPSVARDTAADALDERASTAIGFDQRRATCVSSPNL
jgi:hypothetical protein